MLEWKFEVKHRSQKAREPVQDSFFTNESIDNDTHALVREAIQNSLDAKIDPQSPDPVKVCFTIGKHSAGSSVMDSYITDDAWRHFNATDSGLKLPLQKERSCQYLVFEDFNTTGLVGDETASEPEPNNAFYYFMRAEGQSGKEDGYRGRHGLGKYVFPKASAIRTFIAVTVRSSDGRCLIAGQSLLKSHTVDGQRYTPDAWLGQYEGDDQFQLPVENIELLDSLREEFGLTRTVDAPGLSIIIPFIDSTITIDKISEHLIAEYFYPILENQLVIELINDEHSKVINADSLHNSLDALLPEDKAKKLTPFIELAIKALTPDGIKLVELNLSDIPAMPIWNDTYLNKGSSIIINEALSQHDGVICIRSHLHVKPIDMSESLESYFDIYIAKDNQEEARKPLFIREGISIPEDRVPNVRGFTCIVVIENGPLATLLGDAENPAHTEWEKNAARFKGKYKWGHSTIDFVRLSVTKLIKLLNQADDDIDLDVLADIFYIDLPENSDGVPKKRKKRKAVEEKGEPKPDVPDLPIRPSYYKLVKLTDGFKLSGPEKALTSKRIYTVKTAYAVAEASKATALKRYHKNDFDLDKAKGVNLFEINNVISHEASHQQIKFIADDNSFNLKVTGFDHQRDVIVDVISKEAFDEEI